ncbi:hypothetical protein [Nonomuraea sp. NPDC003214]
MLAVDDSLYYPARLSDDGDTLTPAADIDHRDVIDDAMDELIELVWPGAAGSPSPPRKPWPAIKASPWSPAAEHAGRAYHVFCFAI